jgi:holo-[acyl-carrier protein] synthase
MKVTCGTDIIEVERIKKCINELGKKFINRIFTENEIKYCESKKELKYQHYAARFAAKEAFSKALGTGLSGFSLKDIYIVNDDKGKPTLIAENKAAEIVKEKFGECSIHVSLSHEKEYAIAFVIIER